MSAAAHSPRWLASVSFGALALLLPQAALAQEETPIVEPPAATMDETIAFSADEVIYEEESDLLIARGRVRANRDGYYLAADELVWDRQAGIVTARGQVVVLTPSGDRIIGENVELDEQLRAGTTEGLLLALDTGGRIAAERAERRDGQIVLTNAVYAPCSVATEDGCGRSSWRITAARVTRDENTGRLRFSGGRLNVFGLDIPLLPVISFGEPGELGGVTGALVPDIEISRLNGLELTLPYYFRLARNRDLTVSPTLFTDRIPAVEARYRHLTETGAYQVGAFVTYGDIDNPDVDDPNPVLERDIRAYFEANGRFQFDPYWRLTGSARLATDKTVTRRYDITRDDRLRSFAMAERIDSDSYVSIAGWAFQGLRVDDVQDRIPVALPAIDARWRLDDPVAGGRVELQANSLAILRVDGQDTQRAFAGARWDRRLLTEGGHELTLTAYGRGDVYRTNDVHLTDVDFYRGEEGWHFRGVGALAADLRWPLIGEAFGGTQRFIPRVQLVLTPPTPNLSIPNEDARAIDLEDSNLFALNRFPGYDRWEDGSRVTYGMEWLLDRPNFSVRSVIGQSYRINRSPDIFPDGTGLTGRFSDIVGRTRVRFGRLIDLTHRYRVDKDNVAVRRNELDLTFGTIETYAQIGYLRLDRNIDPALEDLRDKEELRLAGRVKFADYWSLFGSTVLDLTSADEDPLSLADGFEPARHRIGVTYEDDTIEVGLSWRRDYERVGDFTKGSTFQIRFNLKGLGR
ncbi:LPS-assembly protein LptD [Sphingomicrobium lutaoense]|uniref:LPS-assembly protein LptD n=1 Tax=Sphingomicrobium lutaoense TaxID=515949 RepID=A0A839Z1R4_9SPHN|nr:LPS assembly protein LptD [Sphingomicrobium lutaoense]MBB3763612.1 LPS-assembly protein [Sphingomicrobium lutaoense]